MLTEDYSKDFLDDTYCTLHSVHQSGKSNKVIENNA